MERFQETPESLRIVDDLGLQWQVRAALRLDPRTTKMKIAVTADSGQVGLSGVVEDGLCAADAIAVAKSVQGVEGVKSELRETHVAGSRYKRDA